MKVVVRALLRWAWIFLLCAVIGWFGGKELTVLLPPTYQATAVVQINAPHNASSPSQAILPISAYAVMVTSDSVLGTVLKSYPRLNRQSLSKQLVVTSDPSGNNFTIAVTLPNAKEAADFVNALAHLLVSQQNAQVKAQYDTQLQLLQNEIAQEQKSIDALNQKILQTSADNTAQIQQYSTEVDQHRTLQTQYYANQQGLVTQKALYSDPLSVIQTAVVPTRPSSLAGILPWTPLTILIMFTIGGVIVYYLEQWIGRVHSVYALQQKISLPLLGTLRWTQPGPEDMPLSVFSELQLPYVEDCRVMMADILFRAEEANAHVLAITGMKADAGTSSIAAQLAALLAQSKRRVLLIDANLHQPSQYVRLEVPNEAGLARMLEEARLMKVGVASGGGSDPGAVDVINSMGIEKYIIPTQLQNLYLLPAGKPSLNPISLLSMPEMGQFLKWAAQRSDYVIIDCPSLSQAEVHVLGSLSDQAYVVVDATQDRVKQVVEAKDELLGGSVKLSGFIVNKLGRWM